VTVHYCDDTVTLHRGDCLDVLRELPNQSVDCVVTSPPYFGLRDYGVAGQYGLEASPAEYVQTMVAVFAETRRVLASDGTFWLNIGDSYSGSWGNQGHQDDRSDLHLGLRRQDALPKTATRTGSVKPGAPGPKNLLGVPWRVAFALQDDGWILRNAVVWNKPNAMPESVTDRLSCRYEHLFLFTRSGRYWFDLDAIREPLTPAEALDGTRVVGGANKGSKKTVGSGIRRRGVTVYGQRAHGDDHDAAHPRGRNPGDVWTIPTQPFAQAHFAVMPLVLAERCVTAGCKPAGTVLDPFSGSGTTGLAAARQGHRYIGIDLNAAYLDLSLRTRLRQPALDLTTHAPQPDPTAARD
jgi:site-specific DNA-methyltransferase (cytosine-N4-specific)